MYQGRHSKTALSHSYALKGQGSCGQIKRAVLGNARVKEGQEREYTKTIYVGRPHKIADSTSLRNNIIRKGFDGGGMW